MAQLVPESHPALHTTAEEVDVDAITSSAIQKVIRDMRETLRNWEDNGYTGVAIAAPQIGVGLRIFLVEDMSTKGAPSDTGPAAEERFPSFVAINPDIIKSSKKKEELHEGCLSVADRYGMVPRAARVTLRAFDEHGNPFERGASGLLAQIIQHEVDHLDGILFTDRAARLWHKGDTPEDITARYHADS